jgi:hypothetical protein
VQIIYVSIQVICGVVYYFFTILCMKALLITVYWYLVQVEISDNTCLYVEVVDLRCMDFVEDCGSIMARECKILVYRCLIE